MENLPVTVRISVLSSHGQHVPKVPMDGWNKELSSMLCCATVLIHYTHTHTTSSKYVYVCCWGWTQSLGHVKHILSHWTPMAALSFPSELSTLSHIVALTFAVTFYFCVGGGVVLRMHAGAWGGLKRASSSLWLPDMDAGDGTPALCKISACSSPLTHRSSPAFRCDSRAIVDFLERDTWQSFQSLI